jgi:hypothetical protein
MSRKLPIDDQTIQRRILFTLESEVLSTKAAGAVGLADADTSAGLAAAGVRAAPPGVAGEPLRRALTVGASVDRSLF